MAEATTFCHNYWGLHIHKLSVQEVTFCRHQYPTSDDPTTQIRLNFSGKRSGSIYCFADGELLHSSSRPMPDAHIQLDFRQLLDEQKAGEIFGQKLGSWNLLGEELRKLIQIAKSTIWRRALDFSMRTSDRATVLDLHLRVALVHTLHSSQLGYEPRHEGRKTTRKIPADERSIKSLHDDGKIFIASSAGDVCAICLDELSEGCQVVRMPCYHDFHGGCIDKWLRTNHFCPLCRFQMPTTSYKDKLM